MATGHDAAAAPRRPSTHVLLARQVSYQLKVQVRSPIGSFMTLVIPLMVLLAANLLFRGTRLPSRGGIPYVQFFTPAMVAFAVVNACYVSVISSTTLARDEGILKRVRSTPLPAWIYLAGRIIAAGCVAVASSAAVIAVGAWVYGFDVIWGAMPAALLVVAVAIFCFCSLGLAATTLIARADSALPAAWGTMLPLCFISDVFQPIDGAPGWLRQVASALPLRPFADELETLFNPVRGSPAVRPTHLLLLAAWGTAAAVVALIAFRWEPRSQNHHGTGGQGLRWRLVTQRVGRVWSDRRARPSAGTRRAGSESRHRPR